MSGRQSNKWTTGEGFFDVDDAPADLQKLGINQDAVYETKPQTGQAVPRFRKPQDRRTQTQPGVFNFEVEE